MKKIFDGGANSRWCIMNIFPFCFCFVFWFCARCSVLFFFFLPSLFFLMNVSCTRNDVLMDLFSTVFRFPPVQMIFFSRQASFCVLLVFCFRSTLFISFGILLFFFSLSLFLTFNSVHVLFIHTKLDVTKQMNEFSIEVS